MSKRILLSVSGVLTVIFLVKCVVSIFDRKGLNNIMQLFAGFFFHALYFLLPAAIIVATALEFSGKPLPLIMGAVVSVLLAAFILLLRERWIMTIPALTSAVICAVYALNSIMRGK